MSFEADISRFIGKSEKNAEIVVRRISLELFNKVVQKSPVDTGRFRGNWFLTASVPSSQTSARVDKQPYGSDAKDDYYSQAQSNVNRWKLSDNYIYLTNNLPYAYRLEMGYSKQANSGVARISVMEIASKYS